MSTKRLISDKYMIPGLGDGGPCRTTDNIALIVDGNATGGAGNPAGNNTEIQFL
jgi:hypothetical protein